LQKSEAVEKPERVQRPEDMEKAKISQNPGIFKRLRQKLKN
jgi:hypothetical protein